MEYQIVRLDEPTALRYFREQLEEQLRTGNIDTDTDVLKLTPYDLQIPAMGIMVQGQIAGFYRLHGGHLYSLYVNRRYRGHRIARRLLASIQPRTLHVMPWNERAVRLYRSLGFEITQIIAGGRRVEMTQMTVPCCEGSGI